MASTLSSSRVLLAWIDTTGSADFALRAVADGRTIVVDGGMRDAFATAAGVLPWLGEQPELRVPMCAYAVIVEGAPDLLPMRSAFALRPTADDLARFQAEFCAITTALAGEAAAPLLATLRGRPDLPIEIALYAGSASRDGCFVALSDREFAVIATIALARRRLGREELCDRLWPDRDAESALRLLKVYVHRIRTKFGTATVIDTCGGGYRLGEGVIVDIHDLEAVAHAAISSSPVLEPVRRRRLQRALDGVTSRAYGRLALLETFPEIERRVLAAAVDFARMLIDDAIASEDGPRALAIAGELTALDPSDDVAAELHIRTQLRLGRHEAASRHFRSFCRTLRDELDLPPPAHLSRLLQA